MVSAQKVFAVFSVVASMSALTACSKGDTKSGNPGSPSPAGTENYKVKNTVDAAGLSAKSVQMEELLSKIEEKIGTGGSSSKQKGAESALLKNSSALGMVQSFTQNNATGTAGTSTKTTKTTKTTKSTKNGTTTVTTSSSVSSSAEEFSVAHLQNVQSCDDAFGAIKGYYSQATEGVNGAFEQIKKAPEGSKPLAVSADEAAVAYEISDESGGKATVRAGANENQMGFTIEGQFPKNNFFDGGTFSLASKADFAQETVDIRIEQKMRFNMQNMPGAAEFDAESESSALGFRAATSNLAVPGNAPVKPGPAKANAGSSASTSPSEMNLLLVTTIGGGKQPYVKESVKYEGTMAAADAKSGQAQAQKMGIEFSMEAKRESDSRLTISMQYTNLGLNFADPKDKANAAVPEAGEIVLSLEKDEAGQCAVYNKEGKKLGESSSAAVPPRRTGNSNPTPPRVNPPAGNPPPTNPPAPVPGPAVPSSPNTLPTSFAGWCDRLATQFISGTSSEMTGSDYTTYFTLLKNAPSSDLSGVNCAEQVPVIEKLETLDLTSWFLTSAKDVAPLVSLPNLKTVKFSSSQKEAFNGVCPLPADKKCDFGEETSL